MEFKNLVDKELYLRNFVEGNLIDPNGVIYSYINDKTLKPWTSTDIKKDDEYIPTSYKNWDVMNYEDSGMATGSYFVLLSNY